MSAERMVPVLPHHLSVEPPQMQTLAAMMAGLGISPDVLGHRPRTDASPPVMRYDLSKEEMAKRMADFKVWVEREQQLGPAKAPRRSREGLLLQQHGARKHWEKLLLSPSITKSTFVGFAKHSSSTPIGQLSRISISQMLVRKVQTGRYLLCRAIGPCTRMVGLMIPIEDPEGWVQFLSVYNYPTSECASPKDVDALFPPGLILAVREPTFKMGTQGPDPIIRIDSPSDIVHVDVGSDLLRNVKWTSGPRVGGAPSIPYSAEGWKKMGNAHFKDKLWFAAALAYSKGLVVEPSAHILRLNRAEVYLRLGYHSAALADAESVLPLLDAADASRQKALFRAAKAAYGGQDYAGAADKFADFLRRDPDSTQASDGLKHALLRLHEIRDGRYDWARLYEESQRSSKVDAADYVGPIRVVTMEDRGGGRGVVATRSIQVGELLVVAKPFVSVYEDDLPKGESLLSMNLLTNSRDPHVRFLLTCRVISKLYGNPDQYAAVSALYAGPEQPLPPGQYPPALHERSLPSHIGIPAVDIDAARIEGVISFNSFSPGSVRDSTPKADTIGRESPQGRNDGGPAALYLLPSLFNHSCLPNATWMCIGDLMVIRAREVIASGAEITLAYAGLLNTYDERMKSIKHFFRGSECVCVLCEGDREDGESNRQRREELVERARHLSVKQHGALGRLQAMEKEIETTYGSARPVQPGLFSIRQKISCILDERAVQNVASLSLKRSLEVRIEALEALGLDVVDKSVSGPVSLTSALHLPIGTTRLIHGADLMFPVREMLLIARRFYEMGDDIRGHGWLKAAIWVDDKVTGGGKQMLMIRYRDFLEYGEFGPLLARVS